MNQVGHDFQTVDKIFCHSKRNVLLKFVVIGDFGVGKTSIIRRYTDGLFTTKYKITIGADFAIKNLQWDEYTSVTLQLWDIAGHERFGSLTSIYYRYAVAAIAVYDLTRPATLDSVTKWLTDLRRKIVQPDDQHLPIILLANKGDVGLKNVPNDLNDFCHQNNILQWFITSAKLDTNIDEAIEQLVKHAMNKKQEVETPSETEVIKLVPDNKQTNVRRRFQCCGSSIV